MPDPFDPEARFIQAPARAAGTEIPILERIDGQNDSAMADGTCDAREVCSQPEGKGIAGIFPPRKDAVLSGEAEISPTPRDMHILMIQDKGRMAWQKEAEGNGISAQKHG